jgi:hypothetical protein
VADVLLLVGFFFFFFFFDISVRCHRMSILRLVGWEWGPHSIASMGGCLTRVQLRRET